MAEDTRLVLKRDGGRLIGWPVLWWALAAGVLGALLLGLFGWAVTDGALTIAGFGQVASIGPLGGALTFGGIGGALGALAGSLKALRGL